MPRPSLSWAFVLAHSEFCWRVLDTCPSVREFLIVHVVCLHEQRAEIVAGLAYVSLPFSCGVNCRLEPRKSGGRCSLTLVLGDILTGHTDAKYAIPGKR